VKFPTGGHSPQAALFDAARSGEIPVPTVTVRMREDVLRAILFSRNFRSFASCTLEDLFFQVK